MVCGQPSSGATKGVPELENTEAGLHLQLDAQESGILRELLREMRILMEADIPSGDEVMRRLFPRAHEDDSEEAAYRDLVGGDLQQAKREAIKDVEQALGPEGPMDATLTVEEAGTWLRLLNDLRLAIGTRLEVDETKMERTYDPNDPEGPALSVLHWLGWLQGSILEELST